MMTKYQKKRKQPAVFEESLEIGFKGVEEVLTFFNTNTCTEHWFPIKLIEPVENVTAYQPKGIDLLVMVKNKGALRMVGVEIKSDRIRRPKNIFIEITSDIRRRTKGGLIGSKADWIFYFFFETQMLICLPTKQFRAWFYKTRELLEPKIVSTRRGNNTWKTKGLLAPIAQIRKEVFGCKFFRKRDNGWALVK